MFDELDDLPPKSVVQAKEEPPAPPGPCAWCDAPAQGNYWISCDGIGLGPRKPLCDNHGACKAPSAKMIRQRIKLMESLD